jgi:hypothetical protein
MKISIIFTGIIDNYLVDEFIELYKNIDSKYVKIVTTWSYTDKFIIDKLINNKFNIILSDFPENIKKSSVNYQLFSLYKGIELANTFNVTHFLKIRSDMRVSNISRLLNIYERIYCDKPIFIGLINHMNGYLIDYIYFFDISFFDNIINVFQTNNDDRFAEKYMQDLYFGTSDIKTLLHATTTSIFELVKNDIEISFLKKCYREQGNILVNCNMILQ